MSCVQYQRTILKRITVEGIAWTRSVHQSCRHAYIELSCRHAHAHLTHRRRKSDCTSSNFEHLKVWSVQALKAWVLLTNPHKFEIRKFDCLTVSCILPLHPTRSNFTNRAKRNITSQLQPQPQQTESLFLWSHGRRQHNYRPFDI